MKIKNAEWCRIAGVALGLMALGSDWSKAEDQAEDKSKRIGTQVSEIARHISGGAKAGGPELKTSDPQPASGVPARESPNVDFPWDAAKAQRAFEKARVNALDENKLLGRWEQVARANNDKGYYNPQKGGALLTFSSTENPFDDGKRSSVVVIVDAEAPVRTVSFEIRSPSVFFSSQRRTGGPAYHVYEDGFECRLVDEEHLICKRATTGTNAYLTWMGFARVKKL